jgi:hypothetical protein
MPQETFGGVKGPFSPTLPAKLLKTLHRPRREQYPSIPDVEVATIVRFGLISAV